MSAVMPFLVVFAAGWIAVAVIAIVQFPRWHGRSRLILVLVSAGLLVWITGVIAASSADARRWPVHALSQVSHLEQVGKLAGATLLLAGLALVALGSRSRRSG